MIDKLYGVPRKLKDSGKPYKMAFKINKLFAVTLVPFFSLFNKRKGTDENSDVIISLTTYPARIHIVWVTIATLLNQKIKPKRVCLYLAKEQFPNGEEELPKKLTSLKKRGLEILFCDDLKSHKKYYYAIKDNPENIIITADDDMLYPESMTKELLDAHSKYPDTVICEYAHKITLLEDGEIEEYNKWQAYGEDTKPTMGILPVGCGGVLYPPHVLDERIFDKGNAFRILFCDDLGEECQDGSFYFRSFDMKRTENVPDVFKYKFEIYNKLHGLKHLVSTSPFETDYFFTEETDRFMISKLKDCKKYTYQTDESITELPFTEEEFLTNYVEMFDEFPVLTQLIIVEMFYLHYKLEDDFVKYDVIMEIINQLKTLNTNVPYNLACVLYAYLVLVKITVTKLDTADGNYPPDYWGNE